MRGPILFFALIALVYSTSVENEWEFFKIKYTRKYQTIEEGNLRFKIFKEHINRIEKHNAKYSQGLISYKLGINKFTDLTENEFSQILSKQGPDKLSDIQTVDIPIQDVPDSVDWRDKGAVTAVKDQGNCGACYIFSANAVLESHYFLKTNELVNLSEQYILDCQTNNNACIGGWSTNVFKYVRENGIVEDKDYYPYAAAVNYCRAMGTMLTDIGFARLPKNESEMKIAVATIGPIAISLDATTLSQYAGGVYNNPDCNNYSNHAALIVGYGVENGTDYWLMKNSWGADWGEEGYVKMSRNAGNQCNVANEAVIPIL